MQLRQEGCDWITYQLAVLWSKQVGSCPVGQFYKSSLINGYDGGRTGFHQCAQAFLGGERKAAIADQFRNKKPASSQRKSLEAQSNKRFIQRTESFAEDRANGAQQPQQPAGQKGGQQHDGEEI